MLDNVMRGDWGNQKPQKWTKTFKTKKTSTQKNKKNWWRNSIQERNKQTTELKPKPVRIETLNKMSQKGKTEDRDRKYRITDHTDDPKSKTQFLADLLI